jgi:hypothetical protein
MVRVAPAGCHCYPDVDLLASLCDVADATGFHGWCQCDLYWRTHVDHALLGLDKEMLNRWGLRGQRSFEDQESVDVSPSTAMASEGKRVAQAAAI